MRHVHPKRMSKKKNQRYHAKVRMLQHYGKQITNYDLDRMAEIYKYSSDTVILVKQSNRIRKALIWYQGEAYPVIYDKIRKQIVTVLKVEYLTPQQRAIYDNFKARKLSSVTEMYNPPIPEDVDLTSVTVREESIETVPTVEDVSENEQEELGQIEETEEEMNQRLMKEAFDNLPIF